MDVYIQRLYCSTPMLDRLAKLLCHHFRFAELRDHQPFATDHLHGYSQRQTIATKA